MKQCSKCKESKPLECFHKRKARPSGYASHCKTCRSAQEKARYAANAERIIERTHAYNNANREKINARQREYTKANPEKIKAYRQDNKDRILEYERDRRREDPLFRLASNIRRRLRYALSVGGWEKSTKTSEIIGCDWATLQNHLDSQFAPGMTWENMGEWEIDHIIPYATAKTEDDVLRLSHYTNLQPLWRTDNRRKGSKTC